MVEILSEHCVLDSVEVTEPQETQLYHKCNPSSAPTSPSQNGCNLMGFLRTNAFVILSMAAVALGFCLGFALRTNNLSYRNVIYLTFPGELLLRILQMLVLPLIISSMITAMSSVDRKALGKIGLRAILFYLTTTVVAALTGITLVVLIHPGKSSRTVSASSSVDTEAVQTVDSFLDLVRNLLPSNLMEACFRQHKTVYSRHISSGRGLDVINTTGISDKDDIVPVQGTKNGTNVLGLVVFSGAFGLILGSMESEGKVVRDFFDCLNKAIMRLVSIVIWYSPVGTLFLLAGQIVNMADTSDIGREVAMYALTVIAGLLIHSLVTLPVIYFTITRKNPFRFMGGLHKNLSTAFGTASSSATLPVTLNCMEQNLNMDKRVTQFMLPIGATMNMDGAALCQTVAAIFIAQFNNIEFSLSQIIMLSLIVTAVSTGTAGIPQSGMIYLMIVLASVGLPTEDIPLLLIFDWLLDRLRTVTNVLGDCIGVGVVQHLSRGELQIFPV